MLGALLVYAVIVWSLRSRPNAQLVCFLATCAAVWAAAPLNTLLAANWRRVGFTQDYFDTQGVFISIMYSAPLMLIAFVQLVSSRGRGCAYGTRPPHHLTTRPSTPVLRAALGH